MAFDAARYQQACDQPVTATDLTMTGLLVLRNDQQPLPPKERVRRATAYARLDCLQEIDLDNLPTAFRVIAALSWDYASDEIDSLVRFCAAAATREQANQALQSSSAAKNPMLGYLDQRVVHAMEVALRQNPESKQLRSSIQRLAATTGLWAECTRWKFVVTSGHAHYQQIGFRIDPIILLKSGGATYEPTAQAVHGLLAYWADFVSGDDALPKPDLTFEAISSWVEHQLLVATATGEQPDATLTAERNVILITWKNPQPADRSIELALQFNGPTLSTVMLVWRHFSGQPILAAEGPLALPDRIEVMSPRRW